MGSWSWISLGKFSLSLTGEEATDGVDATGLTAIVTGGTSGIGQETARVLALRGAKVIISCRTMEKGLLTKENILKDNSRAKLDVMEMDLASISSVVSFARSFNSSNHSLNILVNNAGIMSCPYKLSEDGIELQFATNHLGHFLLTKLLLDKLKSTALETGVEGRVINVSSVAHKFPQGSNWTSLDNLNDPKKYKRYGAYCRSKLSNILHANELSMHLQEQGANVTANSLHPGLVLTNIARSMHLKANPLIMALAKPFLKSVEQGASTVCFLALHPDVNGITGKYFVNCEIKKPSSEARDKVLGRKLWDFSQEVLTNLHKTK